MFICEPAFIRVLSKVPMLPQKFVYEALDRGFVICTLQNEKEPISVEYSLIYLQVSYICLEFQSILNF